MNTQSEAILFDYFKKTWLSADKSVPNYACSLESLSKGII